MWRIQAELHKLEDLKELRERSGLPYRGWESKSYETIEEELKALDETPDLATRVSGVRFKKSHA